MNWVSKISLSVSAVSLLTLVVARLFFGSWLEILWWPLGFFLGGLAVSLVLDIKVYWSFLTMRTTKDGMNLGLSLVILMAILSSAGYLSRLWDNTYDLTEDKIHSLSDQSVKILDSMKNDGVKLVVFYKGEEGRKMRQGLRENFKPYKQKASYLKVEYHDAYVKNRLAGEYLGSLSDKDSQVVFVFVEYLSKKVRVESPFDEQRILSAMIKASKRTEKNIYFTVGHGELDLFSQTPDGAKSFKSALEESSFNILEWNFVAEKKGLPEDAAALMILGPKNLFFEQEIQWLKEYIENGGSIFIAVDPGYSQNLSPFMKDSLGVDYKNNFIVSPFSQAFSRGGDSGMSVLGIQYDSKHPITRSFQSQRSHSFFNLVSETKPFSTMPNDLDISSLVFSDPLSFDISSLKQKISGKEKGRAYSMGVAVRELTGSVEVISEEESKKEETENKNDKKDSPPEKGFLAVVFGDSGFLTNRLFHFGVHKDLSLNIISYLADEEELTGIRPKKPKGTQVTLTSSHKMIFICMAILLPLLFLIAGGVVWIFRKKA